jgi:hypothetical protein
MAEARESCEIGLKPPMGLLLDEVDRHDDRPRCA